MSIRYLTARLAQQVGYNTMSNVSMLIFRTWKIDEELMSTTGAFSLDQVGLDYKAIYRSKFMLNRIYLAYGTRWTGMRANTCDGVQA